MFEQQVGERESGKYVTPAVIFWDMYLRHDLSTNEVRSTMVSVGRAPGNGIFLDLRISRYVVTLTVLRNRSLSEVYGSQATQQKRRREQLVQFYITNEPMRTGCDSTTQSKNYST